MDPSIDPSRRSGSIPPPGMGTAAASPHTAAESNPASPTFIAKPATPRFMPQPAAPMFVTKPVARVAAYPTVGQSQPTFVHPERLRPGVATGPLMSHAEIDANLRRQARLRRSGVGVWVVLTLAISFTGDTALAVPAGLLWLAATVGIVAYVVRTNRAIDARMRTATAVGMNGEVMSAHRAGRMKLGHQTLCAVAALFTYGVVARSLVFLTQTDFNDPTRPVLLNVLPFAVGIAAAIAAYRFTKAKLLEQVPG